MIHLRKATEADLPLMMAWRSNKLIFEGFYSQKEPLKWAEHLAWYSSKNKDWRTFIIMYLDEDIERPVGVVTIGQLDSWCPDLGILVGEVSLHSRGIGRQALSLGIDWIRRQEYPYQKVQATILKTNLKSIRLFESLGFNRVGEAREGEWRYELTLDCSGTKGGWSGA